MSNVQGTDKKNSKKNAPIELAQDERFTAPVVEKSEAEIEAEEEAMLQRLLARRGKLAAFESVIKAEAEAKAKAEAEAKESKRVASLTASADLFVKGRKSWDEATLSDKYTPLTVAEAVVELQNMMTVDPNVTNDSFNGIILHYRSDKPVIAPKATATATAKPEGSKRAPNVTDQEANDALSLGFSGLKKGDTMTRSAFAAKATVEPERAGLILIRLVKMGKLQLIGQKATACYALL